MTVLEDWPQTLNTTGTALFIPVEAG